MSSNIIHGNCLDVMRAMEPASVDSIVTDPPYGLKFMGKDWDHGVPGAHFWEEALRVAKPGAHLLAFGGTRTFHRLAVAIEDAGWEMRDTLMYLYGSGFPKSHNLKRVFCTCDEGGESKAQHGVRPVHEADIPEALAQDGERGQVLFPFVPEQGTSEPRQEGTESEASGCEQPGMEGRRDHIQEKGELPEHPVPEGAEVGQAHGAQGRVRNGAPVDNGDMVRAPAGSDGSGASQEPPADGERPNEPGTVADESGPQACGGRPLCSWCGKPVPPFAVSGFGTALKPAWEPIIMARKPLIGTVASNVQTHGTGAINVDGCRVEAVDGVPVFDKKGQSAENCYGDGLHGSARTGAMDATTGRWPANVIHDGSDEVVGMFPDTGVSSGGGVGGKFNGAYGKFTGEFSGANAKGLGDSGSAARFFYCAKASKADRDEGLEGLEGFEVRDSMKWSGGSEMMAGLAGTYPDGSPRPQQRARNHHPTVKPTALMRYLCRLVTPPNGVVFDPFTGSGSTGKGAILEGFSFIGCDLEELYVDISKARCSFAEKQATKRPVEQVAMDFR